MKIHCTKVDLYKGVQTIQSALSPRTTLPILLNFLMETEQSTVKLISTDLEMGMKHYIPAEVESDGSITIPAKKFYDIIQSLQDGADVDLTVDAGGKIQVTSGRSRFFIIGAPKSEYPVLPDFRQENVFSLPSSTLTEMLRKTIFAVSSDETRYILNGVFWAASGGNLELVATDGRRLAVIKRKCLPADKDFKIIVPTKVLNELLRLLGGQEGKESKHDTKGEPEYEVNIGITDNQIAFQTRSTALLSRLVEGSFPSYEKVVPSRKDIQVQVGAKDLLAVTKRAALCAADRGGAVRYTFKPGFLHVHAASQSLEVDDDIPLDYQGEEFVVAFNPQFIVDGIKNIDAEEVIFGLTTPANPVLIETAEDPTYQYVMMPMRV